MGSCCTSTPQAEPPGSSKAVDARSSGLASEKAPRSSQAKGYYSSPENVNVGELANHPAIQRLMAAASESVVVLAGAGISVSAGIPDFRSPGTGLYANLGKYKLPRAEAVFELDYFRKKPEAFTMLAKELWPTNFRPTPAHLFVKLLQDRGMLLRHFTQNIDGLDRTAGISDERVVEAHGSFGAGSCIDCRKQYPAEFIRERLFCGEVVKCTCGGLVKPDIVFFGENLPEKFWRCSNQDMSRAKLVVLCMGTSLQVQPFASLATRNRSPKACRILVNREVPGSFGPQADDDLVLLGDCDAWVLRLAEVLGLADEFNTLCKVSEEQEH